MKRFLAILATLILVLNVSAFAVAQEAENAAGSDWYYYEFGDIYIPLPEDFTDVVEEGGSLISTAYDGAVVVAPPVEATTVAADWTEKIVLKSLEAYRDSYTDIVLTSYSNAVEIAASTAVGIIFTGKDITDGSKQQIYLFFLYNTDNTLIYPIVIAHAVDSEYYTEELAGDILSNIEFAE